MREQCGTQLGRAFCEEVKANNKAGICLLCERKHRKVTETRVKGILRKVEEKGYWVVIEGQPDESLHLFLKHLSFIFMEIQCYVQIDWGWGKVGWGSQSTQGPLSSSRGAVMTVQLWDGQG